MRKTILLVMLLPIGVMAKSTLYVGDEIKIPMRADASIAKGNIITHLKINTPVTLIKKQNNGWSNVEHDGKQGFMISRYLTDKKPINHKANELKKQLTVIKNKHTKFTTDKDLLEETIKNQENEILALNQKIMTTTAQTLQSDKLQNKLSVLDEKNNDLIEQIANVRSQNSALHTTDFLTIISSITLLLGFGVGMVMSRLSNNRDNKIYTL